LETLHKNLKLGWIQNLDITDEDFAFSNFVERQVPASKWPKIMTP